MVINNEVYRGTQVFSPATDAIPIDRINFLTCQVVALCFALPFRTCFAVEKVGVTTRHIIETVVGVLLIVFCFGYQIWHLLVQSLISYSFMAYGGKRFSHTLVFVFSMVYLSLCHIHRQIYDYGGYTLDITGPLMIQTQKLTSLAFFLHDGRFKDWNTLTTDQKEQAVRFKDWNTLTTEEKEQAVRKLPNILQYLSYLFYFHGVMVGPLTFYNDYIAFIDGTNFIKHVSMYPGGSRKHPAHGLNRIVFKKLAIAVSCCISMMFLPGMFYPPEKLNTPEYYNMSFLDRMIFILGVMSLAKHKYYFAWILGDAVNNASGFGFSGYDVHGNPKWDLTDNVDIFGVEFATSLKINIESWNKKSQLWLRKVVYDRVPSNNTLAVFACSAFWHGFYPGYYITFGSAALITLAARQVRRYIRPKFQQTRPGVYTYEVITFIATRFANCYLTFPFLVLELYACFTVYKSLYFYYHILSILGLLYLTFVRKQEARPDIVQSSTINQPINKNDSPLQNYEAEDISQLQNYGAEDVAHLQNYGAEDVAHLQNYEAEDVAQLQNYEVEEVSSLLSSQILDSHISRSTSLLPEVIMRSTNIKDTCQPTVVSRLKSTILRHREHNDLF